MRAALDTAPDRLPVVHPAERQDSSMLSVLARSEALLIRAPHAPAARAAIPAASCGSTGVCRTGDSRDGGLGVPSPAYCSSAPLPPVLRS